LLDKFKKLDYGRFQKSYFWFQKYPRKIKHWRFVRPYFSEINFSKKIGFLEKPKMLKDLSVPIYIISKKPKKFL